MKSDTKTIMMVTIQEPGGSGMWPFFPSPIKKEQVLGLVLERFKFACPLEKRETDRRTDERETQGEWSRKRYLSSVMFGTVFVNG